MSLKEKIVNVIVEELPNKDYINREAVEALADKIVKTVEENIGGKIGDEYISFEVEKE